MSKGKEGRRASVAFSRLSVMARFLVLWIALALFAAFNVLAPGLPVAVHNPALSVAISSIAGASGLALLCLGVWRFMSLGRVSDLFTGLAFGTLAVGNLLMGVLIPSGLVPQPEPKAVGYLVLLKRALGAGLLLGGLSGDARLEVTVRARAAWGSAGLVAVALVVATGGILAGADRLADPLGADAQALLATGETIVDFLHGQHLALVLASGGVAAFYLFATLECVALYVRLSEPHLGWLAVALSLLTCSQVFSVLFPPVAIDYVGTADAFRLVAYLVLLFSLVDGLVRELGQRAAAEQRLRISRDLHDGLAQHVGLLNLRLIRATAPDRQDKARLRDLEAARRVAERALVEARQIIATLRAETVSREDLGHALAVFADESGRNYDVEVVTAVTGDLSTVSATDQADILRIASEALSNAVRHGRASRIEIGVTLQGEGLELRVKDNGRGFDPEESLAGDGLGLRSLQERLERRGGRILLDTAPGRGTVVHALFPLRAHE